MFEPGLLDPEDERTNHEANVSLKKIYNDTFSHTYRSMWKVKEVQHGHTHVLAKYDQGQEGLSFAKKKDFNIENTKPEEYYLKMQ